MVEIETKQGKIKGFQIELKDEIGGGSVSAFQNIPFASTKRFRKPELYGAWEGTWDGTQRTTSSPQNPDAFELFAGISEIWPVTEANKALFSSESKCIIDESKLSLAVYTPEVKPDEKKPVMVWIHGGGWQFGSAESYNGAALAKYGDVVVVVLSYRLALFGFLFGNWGLFDQVCGLEWVKENIEAYGGDPNNVTIFGESAGSWSVEALLCSPKASGLFHRAIGQSGSLKCHMSRRNDFRNKDGTQGLMKLFECDSEDALLIKLGELSLDDIIAKLRGMDIVSGQEIECGAVIDGDFFPENPTTNDFVNRVPCLLGFNSTENSGMMAMFVPTLRNGLSEEEAIQTYATFSKRPVDEIKAMYEDYKQFGFDEDYKLKYSKLFCDMFATDAFYGCVLRSFENCNDQPIYHYRLDVQWKMFTEAPYKGESEITRLEYCRSDHGDDIPVMFGEEFIKGYKFCHGKYWSEDEKQLSKRMMGAWAYFAKTGNPGLEDFKDFKSSNSAYVFSTPADKSINVENDEKDLVKFYKRYLFAKVQGTQF